MNKELTSTIVGVFDDRLAAEKAVDALEHAGFKDSEIGFVIRGADAVRGGMITDASGAKDRAGALTGALTGGVVGGVLAAALAVVIPGVGPVLAGGVLASFFGGAVAGTAIGGILGAMTGLGISEEEAQYYEREFHSGKALVAVRTHRIAEAREILKRHGGYRAEGQVPPIQTEGRFSQP